MLDPKIQIFGHTGKLVVADEYETREWRKIGVRKLMRATKLTQASIYSILQGEGVRPQTMHVFRTGLASLEIVPKFKKPFLNRRQAEAGICSSYGTRVL